ncbi:MAG: class I SAM-dependent RNA methyltransferase [Bacteroidota bacterium]|nr:class I SAM-dependent RNA methyltransferase [Bacteroidota bacterium]
MMDVSLEGTMEDCMKLNLHLRTGHRVLWHVKTFKAGHPDELYKEVYSIPWEDFISPDGYISIGSYVQNEHINHSGFANLRTKDAVVDHMQNKFGHRPQSGPDNSFTVLFLHWRGNDCSIYLDTSGDTIAKHGYRKLPFKAPMQESLAAATILASRWDKKSHFVNPMCGSGTLAIEAAMIATNRASGLLRENFGFMHLIGFNANAWKKIKSEAKKAINNIDIKIIASDLSPLAIDAAKKNAVYAGVDHLIDFEICDFQETTVPEGGGVVMFNPEYGERLGEEEALLETYQKIGDFFKKKCSGYFGYIFTGNFRLAKNVGLKTKRKMEFYNSKIECRLLEYEMYSGTRKQERV